MVREGTLFVLVGPSGAGKNTLMQRVQARFEDLPQLATMTTRPQRENEKQGREHWFVTREKFEQLIKDNALVEYQQVHMGNYYGTPRATIDDALEAESDLIADIDFLGADAIRKAYPNDTVIIFVTPSKLEYLAERIKNRGGISADELANRLERARFELTYALQSHYLVVNDDLDTAVDDLYQILASERQRRGGAEAGSRGMARHTIHGQVSALIQRENSVLVNSVVDRARMGLPTYMLHDGAGLPHETLRDELRAALGELVEIEELADKRFDFVAPRYVTLDIVPSQIELHFYYRCFIDTALAIEMPGWEWISASRLDLPHGVRENMLS